MVIITDKNYKANGQYFIAICMKMGIKKFGLLYVPTTVYRKFYN